MKLTAKLQKAASRLKTKRVKKPKPPKPVKKNTWRRKLKALDLKLDRRQRERAALPAADYTDHVCINCGEEFTGRYCPQCGQAGYWSRFSWRQAFLNLLDIWGLGNRPIFRTIHDLFWRPGYMIKDYLDGHRQHYFPPFKLLAITVVFTLFVSLLPGVEINSLFSWIDGRFFERFHPTGVVLTLYNALVWFAHFLSRNLLYEWLFVGIFMVLCIWVAFRRVCRYNLVETYIFLIFVLSQMLLCRIPAYLGNSLCGFVETHALSSDIAGIKQLAIGFLTVSNLISFVFSLLVTYLLLLDFKQFYGLSWMSTIKRLLFAYAVGLSIFFILLYILAFAVTAGSPEARDFLLLFGLMIITVSAAFLFAARYLRKNKSVLNKQTERICKGAMLLVFWGIIIAANMAVNGHKWFEAYGAMFLYTAIAAFLSLLPAIVYKKYQRTWLSFLLLILPVAFLVLTVSILR